MRDLLDLDVDVTGWLPPDDASYGFDNIAGVLKISPTLLERYLSAAQKISRTALGIAAAVSDGRLLSRRRRSRAGAGTARAAVRHARRRVDPLHLPDGRVSTRFASSSRAI